MSEIQTIFLFIFKEMWKCTYIETSAKNNVNIEAVFQEILTLEQKRQLSFQVEEIKVSCLEGSFKIQWGIKTFQDKKRGTICSIL